MEENKIISHALRILRTKRGYTQKQVSSMLGVDRSTYSYYESGKIKPDVRTVMKLSNIFNVHYTSILEAEGVSICLDSSTATKTKDTDPTCMIPLTEKELDTIIRFRLLTEHSQEEILEMVDKRFKESSRKNRIKKEL